MPRTSVSSCSFPLVSKASAFRLPYCSGPGAHMGDGGTMSDPSTLRAIRRAQVLVLALASNGFALCAQGAASSSANPPAQAATQEGGRYDRAFSVVFYGLKGHDGLDGQRGLSGSLGSSGSIGPHQSKAGGRGGDGGRGSNGSNGRPGGAGPDVDVKIGLQEGGHLLLRVRVEAQGQVKWALVDPQGGSLTVRTEGGRGGRGGRGGAGGSGGIGGPGSPSGMPGLPGMNGLDGQPGFSGKGGAITVAVDPKAKPYLYAFHFESPGGPEPVIHDRAVVF